MPLESVSIVIPAYNEQDSIRKTIVTIQKVMNASARKYEIVVVDDGSTDDTYRIAGEIDGVRLLHNQHNLGYGASLKKGIRAADNEFIVICDADGSYPYNLIPRLVGLMDQGVDMVVGWRKGIQAKVPLIRRPVKWVIKKIAENLAGYEIPDINSGLRVFKRSFVVSHEKLFPSGFSFTSTITLLVASSGGDIIYEPIEYHTRAGKSKFHPIKDTWGMITLIIRSVMLFNPLRVFIPVAVLCFLVALGFVLASVLQPGVIYRTSIIIMISSGLQALGLGLLADQINRRSLI